MKSNELGSTNNPDALIEALTLLSEFGARVNQLNRKRDLLPTLKGIAEAAVQIIEPEDPKDPQTSAAIWIYDATTETFDASNRVSTGALTDVPVDHFPRLNGFAQESFRRKRRILSYDHGSPNIHPTVRQLGVRALVCYPLVVHNEAIGVFYIHRYDKGRFDEAELLILDNLAHLAAQAIYQSQKSAGQSGTLARKVRQMEKLKWASELINSRVGLEETLQEILTIGLDLTAAQYGSLELFDKKQNLLIPKALAGSEAQPATETPLPVGGRSVVGRVAKTRRSLLIADLQDQTWQPIYHPLPVGREMRSELAVPLLRADGSIEGVLNIESPQPHAFTTEDQHLLETLAAQAVTAIEEARLLDTMQEIVAMLLTSQVEDLFELIIERACELINASAGAIWTVVEPDSLVLRRSNDGREPGQRLPLDSSLAGQAVRSRQPITLDDMRTHPTFRSKELAIEKGWISAIVVPLLHPHEDSSPVGSFSLYASELRDFTEWDKRLIMCLANHAAVAIREAEQRAELKRAQERQVMAETFAAIGDVGANLVHQLNNKFGAISARVQGIEEKCVTALAQSPYLAKNLQEIANSSQQAIEVVRDSMAQLRLTHLQLVDLSACLASALERADPGPTVEISFINLDQLPQVLAGEKQLEMVFYNLIDNALKAMQGWGKLSLIGQAKKGEVGVTITDTGPGIPQEMQSKIFEFAMTTASFGRTGTRLGFGLWWVKTFVDRFGGRVTLRSEPGKGSAFTVWLPTKKEW